MSIYSANRSGSMVASQATAAVKEGYTHADLGRILYESQVNDMAIFEAVLATDFNEIKSVREGTLLENEIKAFNEKSFKEIREIAFEKLAIIGEKIKELLAAAKRKIFAYIANSGKAFAEEYLRYIEKNKSKHFPSVKGIVYDKDVLEVVKIPTCDDARNEVSNSVDEELKVAEKTAVLLADSINGCSEKSVSSKEYYDKVAKLVFKPNTYIDKAESIQCAAYLQSGKDSIKKIRDIEKMTDKALGNLKKELTKESESENDSVSRINAVISIYQNILSTTTSCCVRIINQNIKNCRMNLALIMKGFRDGKKDEKRSDLYEEAMLLEAAAEVEDYLDSSNNDIIGDNNAIDAEIDKLLNSEE